MSTLAEQLQAGIVQLLGLPLNKISKKGRNSEFSWAALADLQRIHSWLYPVGEYIFLPRKKLSPRGNDSHSLGLTHKRRGAKWLNPY